jgi:adenosylcobinamide-phosphate synthase
MIPSIHSCLSGVALLAAWMLDKWLGDPASLPHPIAGFGKVIACGERRWNRGAHRAAKGAVLAFALVALVFVLTAGIRCVAGLISPVAVMLFDAVCIFFCLSGTTLIREVRGVFDAADRSADEGRRQVARIVGRDTATLSVQEVRTAALETLAENLSDGVVAPLCWLLLLGVPGMFAYKMINTLDSMIGYRNERYRLFGRVAARMDDVANYVPARLTAFLMILAGGKLSLIPFVWRNGRRHISPNAGYPEAALAGILDCRFGGPHPYGGIQVEKPFIGTNGRTLAAADMRRAVRINQRVETIVMILVLLCKL